MRIGTILIGEDIDHWALAQEFIDNTKKDSLGNAVEKRSVRHQITFLELYIQTLEKTLKL